MSIARKDAIVAAVALVTATWRGMDHEGMANRRRMGIYDEFANRVKSAAHVQDLTRFLSRLALKMNSVPVMDDQSTAALALPETDQQAILDALRQDTPVIIAHMRVIQEARREAYKASKAEREKAEKEAAAQKRHQDWLDEQARSGLPL